MDLLDEHQAENIAMLDLRTVSILADYFVICTGTSDRQLRALMEVVDEQIKHTTDARGSTEGAAESGWVLIDYGDVIVHIFSPEKRAFYELEQFWNLATIVVKVQ